MSQKELKCKIFEVENEDDLKDRQRAYCVGDAVSKAGAEVMKKVREGIINDMKNAGATEAGDDEFHLTLRTSKKKVVDIQALQKVCKAKGVEVGKMVYVIHPKNSNVPKKILETLDKYFVLEQSLEVSDKDVKHAVDIGLLTQKDYEKIVDETPGYSLLPTLGKDFADEIIER